LDRLFEDPADIALMSRKELELLTNLNKECIGDQRNFDIFFLTMVQKAARNQFKEKTRLFDELAMLRLHQKSSTASKFNHHFN